MKEKLSILIILVTHVFSAYSEDSVDQSVECNKNPTRMHAVSDLSAVFQETIQNTAVVKISSKEKSNCTGSSISSDGRIITALHCITDCLVDSGYFKTKKTKIEHNGQEFVYDMHVRNRENSGPFRCNVFINGETKTIEVEDAGSCNIPYSEKSRLEKLANVATSNIESIMFDSQCDPTQDYAIVKSEESETGGVCVDVDPSEVPIGEPITAFGFPGRTRRMSHLGLGDSNSTGNQKYVTWGRTVQSDTCDIFREDPSVSISGLPENNKMNIDLEQIQEYGMLQLSNDGHGGFSGGPVFDANGRIRGLIIQGYHHSNILQCSGGIKANSMTRIYQNIASHGHNIEELFTCVP